MPRKRNSRPSYLFHEASGQARIRVAGRDIYLGEYCSPESFRKFKALVAKVEAGEQFVGVPIDADNCRQSQ